MVHLNPTMVTSGMLALSFG